MSYMDRETAIEKLRGYKVNVTSILSEEDTIAAAIDDGIDAAISMLSTMPDADVEPIRHGEWIRKTDTRFGPKLNDMIICSECKIAFSTENMLRRSYCPNCGAKMDEVSE